MATNHRAKIEAIRHAYLRGEFDIDEAKAKVQPLLDDMNRRGEIIAKQYGKKHKPFTFGYIFR